MTSKPVVLWIPIIKLPKLVEPKSKQMAFVVPGQRDNGTSSKSCHGTGRAGTASQNLGWDVGRERLLIFCHGTGRDGILTACPVPENSGTTKGQKGKKSLKIEKIEKIEKN